MTVEQADIPNQEATLLARWPIRRVIAREE